MNRLSSNLAERIRAALADEPNIAEIRMFGGFCSTLNGNMLVGVTKGGDLLVRVGADGMDAALRHSGASPMATGRRVMKGFVVVSAHTLDDAALAGWMAMARDVVAPMPAKMK